jgi:hypothetical protein
MTNGLFPNVAVKFFSSYAQLAIVGVRIDHVIIP